MNNIEQGFNRIGFLVFMFMLVTCLVASLALYPQYTRTFLKNSNHLISSNQHGEVLGVSDNESIKVEINNFLNSIKTKDLEFTHPNLESLMFTKDYELKNSYVVGSPRYDGEFTLVRVDLEFSNPENTFEFPLTLVVVLEDALGVWEIAGLEYDLERFNLLKK